MGSKCKYNQNNSVGIRLLCDRTGCTSLGEITSRQKLNRELNSVCIAVKGFLKSFNVEDLYFLDGIAPPDIRRDVSAGMEKAKQETNEAYSLYGQNPAERRLMSRNCFLRSVKPTELSHTV